MNQLEQLKQYTTVVADSGDIETIIQYQPQDATTNPSIVLKTAQSEQYQYLIQHAVETAKQQGGPQATQLLNAADQVAVDIGVKILEHIPGFISTEVHARLAFDRG